MIAKIIKFLVTIMKGGTMQDFIVNFDKSQKLGIYLKQLREKNNLTIREVKKRTGINTADLSRIESGLKERINPFHLLELSKTYKISVLELYFMIGYLNKNSLIEYNAQKSALDIVNNTLSDLNSKYSKIPLYDLKSGDLNNIYELISVQIQKRELHAFSMPNNSMEPSIIENEIVLFDPKIRILNNNSVGLFSLNQSFLVRRYYKIEDTIILSAQNTCYPPIIIKAKDKFSILGLCVEKIFQKSII